MALLEIQSIRWLELFQLVERPLFGLLVSARFMQSLLRFVQLMVLRVSDLESWPLLTGIKSPTAGTDISDVGV